MIYGSETRGLKFGPLVLTLLNFKKAEQFCSETKVPKFGPLVWTLLHLKKAEKFSSETEVPKLGPLVLTLLNLKKAEQFCSETKGPKFGSLVLTLLNLKKAEPFCSETKVSKFGPLVSLQSEKVALFHTDILQGSAKPAKPGNEVMLYQVIRKPNKASHFGSQDSNTAKTDRLCNCI